MDKATALAWCSENLAKAVKVSLDETHLNKYARDNKGKDVVPPESVTIREVLQVTVQEQLGTYLLAETMTAQERGAA